jgi:hypothetical protein
MEDEVERRRLIAKVRGFPAAMEEKVRAAGEHALDTPCGEGEWTVRQVVHHATDACMNFFVRTKLILTEENPILKPFLQEEWAETPDSRCSSVEASLVVLRGLHERWADLLETVPEPAWERCGIHLMAGKISLGDLLANSVRHCEEHLAQVAKSTPSRG